MFCKVSCIDVVISLTVLLGTYATGWQKVGNDLIVKQQEKREQKSAWASLGGSAE